MRMISQAAQNSVADYERVKKLQPAVEPLAKSSAFGNNLRASMKAWARGQLTEKSEHFEKRMLVLQAQALGMIRALAVELQVQETNADRKQWLKAVEKDYGKLRARTLQLL